MNRRAFTSFDFAYWLQGAIEIAGLTTFTEDQANMIKRRLNDVTVKDELTGTCRLLLFMAPPHEAFVAINDILQKKFMHDIDPTYDGDQDHFQKIHDGAA